MQHEHHYGPPPPPGIVNEPGRRIIWFDGTPAENPSGWWASNFCPSPLRLDAATHERLTHPLVTKWAYDRPANMAEKVFPTGEAAFQAFKTTDPRLFMAIASERDPHEAKRLGQTCDLRPDWNAVKVDVMREVLRAKFSSQNPDLVRRLLATGDAALIECASWSDSFWAHPVAWLPDGNATCTWEYGQPGNFLGQLLVARRGELRLDVRKPPPPQEGVRERATRLLLHDTRWIDLLRERRGMVNFETASATGEDSAVLWTHCTVENGHRVHGTTFTPDAAGSVALRRQFALAGERLREAEERHLAGEEPPPWT